MKNFKFISSNITDPYFNIASEEYLLKNTSDFYIYLWKNSPAVIIGNNQNTLIEVNLKKAEEKGVKVVRRLTGGGAVYHDLNNVCYTIIAPYNKEENSYELFTKPVIDYLNGLGVKACFSGRNDITVNGKKISGNAQVIYKDRIMHHGTLLFNSDLTFLSEVLIENNLKIQSKGIKSIRQRVTNIKEHLPNDFTISNFYEGLSKHLKKDFNSYEFTKTDIEEINKLKEEKYKSYEWNVGKSPKGSTRFDYRFSFGTVNLTFDLVGGIIENAEIFGDFFTLKTIDELISNLNGKRYCKKEIGSALCDINEYIKGATVEEIVDVLF